MRLLPDSLPQKRGMQCCGFTGFPEILCPRSCRILPSPVFQLTHSNTAPLFVAVARYSPNSGAQNATKQISSACPNSPWTLLHLTVLATAWTPHGSPGGLRILQSNAPSLGCLASFMTAEPKKWRNKSLRFSAPSNPLNPPRPLQLRKKSRFKKASISSKPCIAAHATTLPVQTKEILRESHSVTFARSFFRARSNLFC